MGANSESTENKRYFKLIAKAEKAEPNGRKVICEIIKEGNEFKQKGWFKSLSGFVTGIHFKDYEVEGEKKKSYTIELTCSDGIYYLNFSLNFATFGMVNTLLSVDFTKEIEIGAWVNTKTGFVQTGVKYVGETDQIKWSVELKDQPKGEKYKTPSGKVETDYSNVKSFWDEKFLSLKPKCIRSNFTGTIKSSISANQNFDKEAPTHIPDNDTDDLPF